MKNFCTILIIILTATTFVSCGGSDDSGNDGGGGSFSYTDIGPNLSSDWHFSEARRTDTGIWVWYYNINTVADKLARYDFTSKQWQFWDFPQGIEDFDVWLEGEDNGTGAVVVENINNSGSIRVRSLSSASPWDIEMIQWAMGNVAVGWGIGSAAFNQWLGGRNTNHRIYQETGTCCPMQWNLADDNNVIQSYIYNMWASSRQDQYLIVSTADKSFMLYGSGGNEITFNGNNYAIEHLAWDTHTRIPYVLIEGILYKIEVNPNAHTAQAIEVADLSHLNYGITMGSVPLDIYNGKAFVPYEGTVVDLSNGSLNNSWVGQYNQTDLNSMAIITAISSSSQALFIDPNDTESIYVHIISTDPTTFEPYETWIWVNNAL